MESGALRARRIVARASVIILASVAVAAASFQPAKPAAAIPVMSPLPTWLPGSPSPMPGFTYSEDGTNCYIVEGGSMTTSPITSDICMQAKARTDGSATPSVSPAPTPSPLPVRAAPTVNLALACPVVRSVTVLESQAHDAHMVASFEKERDLYKQAALAYLRCSEAFATRTDDRGRYVHDRAGSLYAQDLARSFTSPPDPKAVTQMAQYVADLRGASIFADVQATLTSVLGAVPATPSPTPTSAPIDKGACELAGFVGTLSEWYKTFDHYNTQVGNTNWAGQQKNTWLNQLNFALQSGSEKGDVTTMGRQEGVLRAAVDTMRSARAIESARLAAVVVDHVHETTQYAANFTENNHRGAAAVSDRDHLIQSKLAVDSAAGDLRRLPICEK